MKSNLLNKYGALNALSKEQVSQENIEVEDVHYDPTMNKFFTDGDPAAAEQTPETEALSVDPTPATQLIDDMRVVSNEAAFVGNLQNYFSRKSDKINMSIREGFKYLTTMNYNPMELLHPMQMESFVAGQTFDDNESLKVPQPAGFKGDMMTYTSSLVVRAGIMNRVLSDVLRPAASRFGYYLSMPMETATRSDFEAGILIDVPLEQLVKDEAEFFGSGRGGTASLGELFTSYREFVESEQNMMQVQNILSQGNTSEVKRAVEALSITATALIKRLGEDKQNRPSNEFAKMIGEQLSEVARWVEWYSAQMTRIIETNNCLYAIEKEIRKLG